MPRWNNGWGFQFVQEFRKEDDLLSGGFSKETIFGAVLI